MNTNECFPCGQMFESDGIENICPLCEHDSQEAYENWADAHDIPEEEK